MPCCVVRFHVEFHEFTFAESVITLKTSRKRATRKAKRTESMCHLDFLKDLGEAIVGKEKTTRGTGLLAPYG